MERQKTVGQHHDNKPVIVTLCGSTRFYETFQRVNYEQTMLGKIVLSVGFYVHSAEAAHGEQWGCTSEQKEMLDKLHLRKIDLADEVFIINQDGYIGESTRRELLYALQLKKRICWLEPEHAQKNQLQAQQSDSHFESERDLRFA